MSRLGSTSQTPHVSDGTLAGVVHCRLLKTKNTPQHGGSLFDFPYNALRLIAIAATVGGPTVSDRTRSIGMSDNTVSGVRQRGAPEFPVDFQSLLKDTQALLDNADRLESVVATQGLSAASVPRLTEKIAKALSLDESKAGSILRALRNAKQFQQNNGLTPQQTVEKITTLLQNIAPDAWKSQHLDSWKARSAQVAASLQALNDDHPLFIATKAQELAYTHENILVSSRIITDIRPVFDSSAEQIRELVVTNTLFIRYSDANQEPCIASFALDSEDVANLLHECQRAATKTKTIKESLNAFNPIVLPETANET